MTDGTGMTGEAGRLAALQRCQILDTGPEKAFDDITFLASHVCAAPIAYLSLIDANRQWFKSKIGLTVSEVPRHCGLAAYSLTQTDIFVVTDVAQDDRFASSPLVMAEPSVRFYAAAPLMTHDRQVIGTLSVADRIPHNLSFEQKEALRALSRQAVVQLELRRKLAEPGTDTLDGERSLLQSLIEHVPDLIYVKDAEGRYVLNNLAHVRFLGARSAAEVRGKTVFGLFPPELARQYHADDLAIMRSGEPLLNHEEQTANPGGERIWLSTSKIPLWDSQGKVVGLVGIARDITERKCAEERLLQAQKIDAVGRLAGGVAHDFNNLLTAILGYSELLLRRQQNDNATRRHAEEIRKAAERGAALTQQLLAFSRKQTLRPSVLDLNAVVADMDKLLRRLISENIKFITVPGSNLGCVQADPSQLEQVILNLVINASDAMPNGGTLTIETGEVALDEEYVRHHPEVKPGIYVMLAISDTGVGMTSETKAHLFEPFFTTKNAGKGTGLGLATCYGIVKQSGGHISVYSELGRGTTIKVYLAHIDQSAGPVRQPHGQSKELPRGHETILIVEDEPSIRELTVQVLRELGYTVLQAADGEEALRVNRQYHSKIDLLVTDVIMPQVGASELVARLVPLRPKMKVLYVSGYTDLAVANGHHLIGPIRAFLQKPFTPSMLACTVRQVLDGKSQP